MNTVRTGYALKNGRFAFTLILWIAAVLSHGQLANSGWPKFRGNALNNGLSSGSSVSSSIKFVAPLADTNVSSPAIGADGTVYMAGGNVLAAMDGSSGVIKWTFDAGELIYSSPSLASDGTVYIGSVHKMVALQGSTGQAKWSYSVLGTIFSSPAIGSDGTVYFGDVGASDISSHFYAVRSDGTLKWSRTSAPIVSSPALAVSDIVYVGSTDGYLYALNPSDGTVVNSYQTGGEIQSAPAIAQDGSVYFCSGDGYLYSLTSALSLKWTYNTGSTVEFSPQLVSSPAVGPDGSVYVGTLAGDFHSVSSTGQLNWKFQVGQSGVGSLYAIQSSAAIGADGTVYLGPSDGFVYALSSIGQVNWKVNVTNPSASSPALGANGMLYVGVSSAVVAFSSVLPNSVTLDPQTVVGGKASTCTIYLSGAAPVGGVKVAVSSSDPSAITPSAVVVPAGQLSVSFTVQTSPVSAQKIASILCTLNGVTKASTLTITPPSLVSLSINPSNIVGGNGTNGVVTLSGPAPAGGITVNLSSNNSVASLGARVAVSAGQSSGNFPIVTSGVSSPVTIAISASFGGVTQASNLTVVPADLASIQIAPNTIIGPGAAIGTVSLNGAAPVGGAVVKLLSTVKALVVPTTVKILAGRSSNTFIVQTAKVVRSIQGQVQGKYLVAVQKANVRIIPLAVVSITLAPTNVQGGMTSTATVTLNGVAPSPGVKITLSSSNSAASVPASVVVPTGQSYAVFTVITKSVSQTATAAIGATLTSVSQTATLTINPSTLASLTVDPTTVTGGNQAIGTVTLDGPAGPGGASVTLSADSVLATIPATVIIPEGQTSANFNISTSATNVLTSVKIRGSYAGSSQAASLTILAAQLTQMTVSPANPVGGNTAQGTVTISGPAPAEGITVTISSSSGTASVPASVGILAGQTTATFDIATKPVTSAETVTLTGSFGGRSATATLTVNPAWLAFISVAPKSVYGGNSSTGTVTLSGPAPGLGVTVTLSSNSNAASVPASVVIPGGSRSATFTIQTTRVRAKNLAGITGSLGDYSRTAILTIKPLQN